MAALAPDPGPQPGQLPYLTPETPGIGGEIKQSPAHFEVEEIPLYPPAGVGGHLYLNLTREGQTTRDLVDAACRVLGLNPAGVGYAGLKDKEARVSQTLSFEDAGLDPAEAGRRLAAALDVRVNWASRHGNKLKPGHLLGNRFRILVQAPGEGAAAAAELTARLLRERGVANFFGPQRFGQEGDNAARGRELVLGARPPRQKWLKNLYLSAYQSELFNRWLAARLGRGEFLRLLAGDVAKKTDTGGLFTVEDPVAEEPRLTRGEITYTGPLYGAKMMPARAEAGRFEDELLAAEGLEPAQLKKAHLPGSRRPARIFAEGLAVEEEPRGLWFSFALPKGSYATVVLREFMKRG
ncbi:MAG: tRNA pseudouridine(13) synthase TruD [Deltaproteobacteria bacterium]|nr:tRNA pseudouridine(13) synthase TruD [Deltaproteobacteria bacterium]